MRASFRTSMQGYTLFEVMITIIVLAIMMGFAVPSFQEAVMNGATSAQTNDLVAALQGARSEATKQVRPVRVSALGGNWAAGWELATDRDRSGALNDDDVLLRTGDPVRDGFQVSVQDIGGVGVNHIWFDASGRLLGSAQPIMLTVRRPDGDLDKSRRLCIALSGRVESKIGETACL